jgi:hypothetical protein
MVLNTVFNSYDTCLFIHGTVLHCFLGIERPWYTHSIGIVLIGVLQAYLRSLYIFFTTTSYTAIALLYGAVGLVRYAFVQS